MSPFFYCIWKSEAPAKLLKFYRGFAFVLFAFIL